MTQLKANAAMKKVTTAKSGSAVAGKLKNTKVAAAATAKKAAVKTTAVKKTKASAVKKAVAPAGKKGPEKKAPATKAATTKAKPATTRNPVSKPSPEERYRMVETTAYFIAERNGFQGDSTEHWAAAEREIASKLGR